MYWEIDVYVCFHLQVGYIEGINVHIHASHFRIFSFNAQDGVNPLHIASQKCYNEIVGLILQNGVDPNQPAKVFVKSIFLMYYWTNRITLYCVSMVYNSIFIHQPYRVSVPSILPVVRAILRLLTLYSKMEQTPTSPQWYGSCFIKTHDYWGWHYEKYVRAVPLYTLHSISAPCFFSQTPPHSVPLGVASQKGHTQTVERLLDGGANINHQDVVRSMHMLVWSILSHYKHA